MSRSNIVFRGLSRPAEWGGLPVLYLMVVLGLVMAVFYLFGIYLSIVAGFLLYVGLRLFYEWEPAFFRLLSVTFSKTPPTRTRRQHGGDFYNA
ncbi:VirB3 family type IV secretion system protein [uncultured Ruegeria sp.]|uniref:VirB3 family type IV secretion system protein n=1 Tax=uncultured Ruegeria sp. TaxID=259304 RepID=UPI0026053F09|nr:VirB3 family type IV secretion system protein [uncultured Ruegeria sp.]